MAFLNIALEWLCDHQHNSFYYSFGPSTHFSLYQVLCVIIAELGVNPRLWFLAVTDVTVLSTGSNSQSVNWPPQSLSRFMESLRGHRRLPGEAVQGAGPAPRAAAGEFLAFVTTLQVHKLNNDLRGNADYTEKLYLNGPWRKIKILWVSWCEVLLWLTCNRSLIIPQPWRNVKNKYCTHKISWPRCVSFSEEGRAGDTD